MIDPVLHWLAAAALALLFLAAAAGKARDLRGFAAVVAGYRLLPGGLTPALAPLVAGVLVLVEAALAIALCLPATWPVAAACALGLLGLYTLAMGLNLARGRSAMDCGCLGAGRRPTIAGAAPAGSLSPWLLLRNSLVMLLPVLLLLPPSQRELDGGDAAIVAAGVAALALAWRVLDELIANQVALQAWLDGDA